MHLRRGSNFFLAASVLLLLGVAVVAGAIEHHASSANTPDASSTEASNAANPDNGSNANADSPPGPIDVTIPANTPILVDLDQTVSTRSSRPGDHFAATIAEPITESGETVIPRGAQASGLVVDAHSSGHLKGRALLELVLVSVQTNGQSYDIRTTSETRVSGNHKKHNFGWIGGSAGAGALIGALAAGGKGALIGGPVGAGAGTTIAYLTGKKNVTLRAETPLRFRIVQPLTVSVPPPSDANPNQS